MTCAASFPSVPPLSSTKFLGPKLKGPGGVQEGKADFNVRYERSGATPELLSGPDEDSFGSPYVAEPIHVFVLGHFADEFRAALAETGERIVDVQSPSIGARPSSSGLHYRL
jgi:hypothetical protein